MEDKRIDVFIISRPQIGHGLRFITFTPPELHMMHRKQPTFYGLLRLLI